MNTLLWWRRGKSLFQDDGHGGLIIHQPLETDSTPEFLCFLPQLGIPAHVPKGENVRPQFVWPIMNWAVDLESKSAHERRAKQAFDQWLRDAQMLALREAMKNADRVRERSEPDHFYWVVDHQVKGLTYREISESAGTANRSIDSIKNEVTELKRELGLRGERRGRPSSKTGNGVR